MPTIEAPEELTNNTVLWFANGMIGIVTKRMNLILIDKAGLMNRGDGSRISAREYLLRHPITRFEPGQPDSWAD